MTFKQFILSRRALQNPRGDFIRDARSDESFPDAKSWEELEAYLNRECNVGFGGACPEAIEQARALWRQWSKWQ